MHNVLAGSPGPQASPATAIAVVVILVLALAGTFCVAALSGSSWRKSMAGARQEALTGGVTASWPVRMPRGPLAFHGPGMGDGRLILRDGFIEVTSRWPVARTLNRGEFYFPVRETRLRVEAVAFGRQRLVISGPSGGQPALISVSPRSRAALEQMWVTLTEAGAIPRG